MYINIHPKLTNEFIVSKTLRDMNNEICRPSLCCRRVSLYSNITVLSSVRMYRPYNKIRSNVQIHLTKRVYFFICYLSWSLRLPL